jgi:hypothetical protein
MKFPLRLKRKPGQRTIVSNIGIILPNILPASPLLSVCRVSPILLHKYPLPAHLFQNPDKHEFAVLIGNHE